MTLTSALKYLIKPLFVGFVVAISILNFYNIHLTKLKRTQMEKIVKHQEVNFWSEVIKQNGSYRDAYLKLSNFYQNEGNPEIAKIYLKKAYMLDPNNEKVKGAYSEESSF